jgi:hypothetical protein
VTVKAKAHIEPIFDSEGFIEPAFVDSFDLANITKYYLQISEAHFIPKIIPIEIQYEIGSVKLRNIEKTDVIDQIDFGEVVCMDLSKFSQLILAKR